MTPAQVQSQIDYKYALMLKYQNQLDIIIENGMANYELDTGQSRQKVTKLDESRLNAAIARLENQCATLSARLNGSGSHIGRMV